MDFLFNCSTSFYNQPFFLNRSIIKKTDVRIFMALENLGMLRNCEIFEEV